MPLRKAEAVWEGNLKEGKVSNALTGIEIKLQAALTKK